MKKYWTLYRKELKSIYGMAVFLIVVNTIMVGVSIFQNLFIGEIDPFHNTSLPLVKYVFSLIYQLGYATIYMLPVILVYSLNIEKLNKSHYQLLGIPVRKSEIMFGKFLAVASLAVILVFLQQVSMNLTVVLNIAGPFGMEPKMLFLQLTYGYILFLLYFCLYCSVVCTAQGVMEVFKRNRMLVWVITCIGCYTLTFLTLERISSWFELKYYPETVHFHPFNLLLPAILSIIWVSIGLFLYEKYAEV